MLISDNLPVRKCYFDSNIIARILRRFFLRIILMRMSTLAHVYMQRHQGAKVKDFDVSNVIYHKIPHGAVSCTLNGENVNVMLEYTIIAWYRCWFNSQLLQQLQNYSCSDNKVLLALQYHSFNGGPVLCLRVYKRIKVYNLYFLRPTESYRLSIAYNKGHIQ